MAGSAQPLALIIKMALHGLMRGSVSPRRDQATADPAPQRPEASQEPTVTRFVTAVGSPAEGGITKKGPKEKRGRETIAVDHEEQEPRQAELSGFPCVRFSLCTRLWLSSGSCAHRIRLGCQPQS